ncbi:hypothetical protein V5P93_005025 [Actinokineospora auranticolor]|uniref:Uncharacterized protein n=1 Tax=Actinokineospora auranticolor TaxID=155976 RepID=A0A2S6GJZ3_9PSEU|nr:hypothetical protein [Actinokineospora auranticolor]PPK65552.1 hypothetical protein CLV40_11336 [Actinokineospora auranticolor]
MRSKDPAAVRARVVELSWRLRGETSPDPNLVTDVNRRYRALLPDVGVARCPDSGEPVRWPIDVVGFDGRFWDYLTSIRRTPEEMPPGWLAMTGAVRLAGKPEHPPFAVVPGPDVPFVVPRILDNPGVRAVIAEVRIGAHTGWAISYFGPKPEGVTLVNLWGENTYPVRRQGGGWGWAQDRPRVSQYDFDLAPWLRSGKVLWLEPGDESLTLREGAEDCPFVGLDGRRQITIISTGEVRWVNSFAGYGAG